MNELEQQLLRRLLDDPERLSRNRNFHSYQDPTVKRTARLSRVFRSLCEDLVDPELLSVTLDHDAEPRRLAVELYWDARSRTTYVTEAELAILLEDEAVAGRLAELLRRAEDHPK